MARVGVVSLTKTELCELVDRVFASWNQQIPVNQQKEVYNAWWRILKDLNKEDCELAIDTLVKQDSYMPRPGNLYKETIRIQHNWNPPTPLIAWEQFRTMADAANTGTWNENLDIHPEVKTVVKQLGGTRAYNLHTNGDREHFITTYEQHLRTREQQLTTGQQDDQPHPTH